MSISTKPLTPRFGVEIQGVDLNAPISDADFADIERLWYENGVILFRDQTWAEPDIIDFSRRFGELEIHVREEYLDPEYPELLQVSNIVEGGRDVGILKDKELGWHHDQSYMKEPAIGSLLSAFKLPTWGGETSFANLAAAYEDLGPGMHERLSGLRAVHSYEYFNGSWSVPTNDTQSGRTPPVLQPVVRTHPVTGRKALYIDPAMVPMIDGLGEDESRDLLDDLFERIVRPEYVYRHEWRLGDALMWDNAATI
ncbi:MAG: TauD/TfdA family dioxygenase, partial [Rhodospirillaceae bacterium]|nr:TauD/TfdA family dioxygenase [Rhodospirillaceae bacterium]